MKQDNNSIENFKVKWLDLVRLRLRLRIRLAYLCRGKSSKDPKKQWLRWCWTAPVRRVWDLSSPRGGLLMSYISSISISYIGVMLWQWQCQLESGK